MATKADSEFADLLHTILISNRQDGLVADVAAEGGVSESLVYRWTQGKEEPRPRHLRAVVRVLRRRGRTEEAAILLDALLLDSGAQGVLLPEDSAGSPRSTLEWLSEAGEQVFLALRAASSAAPNRTLQYRAHVWSATRALHSARLAAGA